MIDILKMLSFHNEDSIAKGGGDNKSEETYISQIIDGEIRVYEDRIRELASGIGEGIYHIEFESISLSGKSNIETDDIQNEIRITFTENAWGGISIDEWEKIKNRFDGYIGTGGFVDYFISPSHNTLTLEFAREFPIGRYAKGGGVINVKVLEGSWQSYDKGRLAGNKDEGYVTIENEYDLTDYIESKLGNVVKSIKLLERGKRYPYNRSNPYSHETYLVTLNNGTEFNLERQYGVPNWSGNVDYIERISIENIKYANGGGVGDENDKTMREKIAEMNIALNTKNGQVYVGGIKSKNRLFKDEKGYYVVEGYGKFMGKKYPLKKHFSMSENEVLDAYMQDKYASGGGVPHITKVVAFPEHTDFKYYVIGETDDKYVVVNEEKVEHWKNANITDRYQYFEEELPKGDVIVVGEQKGILAKGGSVLLAPNGKPSNLRPEQYKLVRTPEFKAWFGDWENPKLQKNMLLDENKEPKIFWNYGKNEWNKINKHTIYDLTDEKIQGRIFLSPTKNSQFYYEIQHKMAFEKKSVGKLIDTIEFKNYKFRPFFVKSEKIKKLSYNQRWRKQITNNKNEVFIVDFKPNKYFEKTYKVKIDEYFVILTTPSQIKLADGTNTTFDSDNPDIRYAKGGKVENVRYYIDYLNIKKREKDRKYFDSIESARDWAFDNLEKYNPDMIHIEFLDNQDSNPNKKENIRTLNKRFEQEKPSISLPIISSGIIQDLLAEYFSKLEWNSLSDSQKEQYNSAYRKTEEKFFLLLQKDFLRYYFSDDNKRKFAGHSRETINRIESAMRRIAKEYPIDISIEQEVEKNQTKGYKLGDKWSSDFDYDGMFKVALSVDENWTTYKLQKLYDSMEDVNYHTLNESLYKVIENVAKGEKSKARAYALLYRNKVRKQMEE